MTAEERVSYRDKLAEALITRIKAGFHIDPATSPGVVGQPFAATEYDLADAVLAVRDVELDRLSQENDRLAAKIAEYENAITWETSCLACSATLDSSIKEHERAERAEAAIERVNALRDKWLSWPEDDPHYAAGLMLARYLDKPPAAWCTCGSCWGWFVEEHPGEDLDGLGTDRSWWSGLPVHRDPPPSEKEDPSPDHDPATLRPGEPPTKVHTIPLPGDADGHG